MIISRKGLCLLIFPVVFITLQIDTSLTWLEQIWLISGRKGATEFEELIWLHGQLPRVTMALLVGATLGSIGSVIQQLTRNPLLSPVTLGSSSGAWLGLIVLAILWPEGQENFRTLAAMVGAMIALGFVVLISGLRNLSGLSVVLAGMAVNLLFGAMTTALILLNDQYARNLFIWGAGDLGQNGWEMVQWLWPNLLPLIAILLFAGRPLDLLKLGMSGASGRGLNTLLTFIVLMVAGLWALSAAITAVGIIGFLGLIAPNLARMLNARTASSELFLSFVLGAFLLLCADMVAQLVSLVSIEIVPTGLTTALIGAPIFIWLIRRKLTEQEFSAYQIIRGRMQWSRYHLPLVISVLFSLVLVSLFTHQTGSQLLWQWPELEQWILRWPRIVAALFAGAGMAASGVLIQRIIHNPLASPDLLGMSAGAVFALVIAGGVLGAQIYQLGPLIAFVGSGGVLLVLLFLGRRFRFAPLPMILTGIAISALIEALVQTLLARGGTEVYDILVWLAGSTYRVSEQNAIALAVGVFAMVVMVLSLDRWIVLLALGRSQAVARGLNVPASFLILLSLCAALCAYVTALVGPISFVSIIAPHIATLLGARTSRQHMLMGSFVGANLLLFADWLGQVLIYPYQLAAGTVVAILGGSYFAVLLIQQQKRMR
ncbi:Fe(3+)-hydroxamate ABC transporter permease FhuB [Marinomonas mediterranea]|jgi:ABC-type Fe3+-siderophore transport system, permease component|uniref:ABC-type transporter, integral membrane subunit n=1 Tax=Marinomonas mediterranea (strain ATCC 700492 / JCM 21426 / NBRC 103028 / MMB-1) TaxID=717774 RepID=F2JZB4_MARM1|nr:Fe(3+)-hydroxamate ABC transporter permease FhuB [Marinomonas mediterranea]ADZ93199.1 ABC-type transporter, integral membrane subunit [Marinomonas mediterranea MMB-1]WCN15154.1 Fe(3+)-hydroxamate ABC transporter permease FhuB [Marinomonas mediterranea]WCN19198.1 Fe(3+)-hydroxamate ABC transporter permease FhuB [Marinomonas mediterranea MMB-1]